jgi:hypothetical protein
MAVVALTTRRGKEPMENSNSVDSILLEIVDWVELLTICIRRMSIHQIT